MRPESEEKELDMTLKSIPETDKALQQAEQRIESLASSLASTRTDPLLGQLLDGKIRVVELIGKGGVGAVYRGEHTALGQDVAIKVLTGPCDEQAEKRFQQEAKAAFKLRHKHIASVHDAGLTPQNSPYLVMDYVRGEAVSSVIHRHGPFAQDQALAIVLQACAALKAAHEGGIVHRDIKPSNMLFTDQSNQSIRLVDFGIAKDTNEDKTLTSTGQIVGSPQYMSPEQCQGYKIDARSDIYSLGCVLVQLLTGKTPFKGDNPLSFVLQHISNSPATLAELAPNTKFSPDLQAVIWHALAKDPAMRYQTIDEFAEDLAAVRANQPVKYVGQKGVKDGNGKKAKSKTVFAISALLVSLALIGAAAVFTLSVKSADPGKPNSDDPGLVTSGSRDLQNAERLDQLAYNYYKSGQFDRAIPLLEFGIRTYRDGGNRAVGVGREDNYLAENLAHVGECYLRLNKADKSVPYFQESLRLYQKLQSQYQNSINSQDSVMPEIVKNYAEALQSLGRTKDADDMLADFAKNNNLTHVP